MISRIKVSESANILRVKTAVISYYQFHVTGSIDSEVAAGGEESGTECTFSCQPGGHCKVDWTRRTGHCQNTSTFGVRISFLAILSYHHHHHPHQHHDHDHDHHHDHHHHHHHNVL